MAVPVETTDLFDGNYFLRCSGKVKRRSFAALSRSPSDPSNRGLFHRTPAMSGQWNENARTLRFGRFFLVLNIPISG